MTAPAVILFLLQTSAAWPEFCLPYFKDLEQLFLAKLGTVVYTISKSQPRNGVVKVWIITVLLTQ